MWLLLWLVGTAALFTSVDAEKPKDEVKRSDDNPQYTYQPLLDDLLESFELQRSSTDLDSSQKMNQLVISVMKGVQEEIEKFQEEYEDIYYFSKKKSGDKQLVESISQDLKLHQRLLSSLELFSGITTRTSSPLELDCPKAKPLSQTLRLKPKEKEYAIYFIRRSADAIAKNQKSSKVSRPRKTQSDSNTSKFAQYLERKKRIIEALDEKKDQGKASKADKERLRSLKSKVENLESLTEFQKKQACGKP